MRPDLRKPRWNDRHTVEAQRVLSELGYYDGLIDGDFGDLTDAAVRAFQRDRHLRKVDGIVGKETWAALDAAALELAIAVVERPDGTQLAFVSAPGIKRGERDGVVTYAVKNTAADSVHGWRDRLRIVSVDGDPVDEVVVPFSQRLDAGQTTEYGVLLTGLRNLSDGRYDLEVELNIHGLGERATVRLDVRDGATFPLSASIEPGPRP